MTDIERAKVLTEAAAEALKVADNCRACARGAAGEQRDHLLAKARGADAVMVHLIKLANADNATAPVDAA